MTPSTIPITVPAMLTASATLASRSRRDLATAANTIAVIPRTSGQNRNETAPSTIAVTLNPFPGSAAPWP